jgi:uncharacterized membrane protein YphA (DoxX/SURF4 family)
MKTTKIIYWIVTGLFALFMISDGIQEILQTKEAADFIIKLGYPTYFVPFLGVAKILGSIAILIPGFPRLKEWAYAGFIFDLGGATYSIFAKGPFQPQSLTMFVFIGFAFASYFLYHKKLKDSAQAAV